MEILRVFLLYVTFFNLAFPIKEENEVGLSTLSPSNSTHTLSVYSQTSTQPFLYVYFSPLFPLSIKRGKSESDLRFTSDFSDFESQKYFGSKIVAFLCLLSLPKKAS